MTGLSSLLGDLERALAIRDLDLAASVRRTIVEGHPGTTAAAESAYKLGLDALYRRHDLDAAVRWFRGVVRAKAPKWSAAARVSLALVLLRQQKHQRALFELRKAASADPPTLLSAQAAGLAAVALAGARRPGAEVERARDQAKSLLTRLTASSDPEIGGGAAFILGMEFKFDGDRQKARTWLERAVASGVLSEDERCLAEQSLEEL